MEAIVKTIHQIRLITEIRTTSRKSLRTAYGMGKVFNGMKKVGSKLRVSMLMVNDLVSGSFIMKIDL